MRSDQHMGLSERAEQYLKLNCEVELQDTKCTRCKEVISSGMKRKTVPGRFYWSGFASPDCAYSCIADEDGMVDYGPTCLECVMRMSCKFILPGYQLKDGSVVYTKVQAEPWSSGPCFFHTLVKVAEDGSEIPIVEANWTDYEIKERT